jgi:hypothetical protein
MIRSVEIINWKDLVEHFGLTAELGHKDAKHISRELRAKFQQVENPPSRAFILYCPGEGEACFELVSITESTILYEFIGTQC